MKINNDVYNLMEIFNLNNFDIYIVGGFVRDYLLNRQSNDYDLCTNASVEEMLVLANKYNYHILDIGKKHGTIVFCINDFKVEVTTYRIDQDYLDYRHPSKIIFTNNLEEDLLRRDFTINSLCLDKDGNLIDLLNGKKDLNDKIIKAIGDPNVRFNEDALRMLRAIRFSLELNFKIDDCTFKAIQDNANLIKYISSERIRDELIKMVKCDNPNTLVLLKESNLLDIIIPEFKLINDLKQNTIYHCYDVFNHTNAMFIMSIGYDYRIRLACMLHDLGKGICHTRDSDGIDHFKKHAIAGYDLCINILKRLKFSKKDINFISLLVLEHDIRLKDDDYQSKVNDLFVRYQDNYEFIIALLDVVLCDNLGKSDYSLKYNLHAIYDAIDYVNYLKNNNCCVSFKQLAINGNDLVKLGYNKDIKDILTYLLHCVLENQCLNKKDILLKLVKERF